MVKEVKRRMGCIGEKERERDTQEREGYKYTYKRETEM